MAKTEKDQQLTKKANSKFLLWFWGIFLTPFILAVLLFTFIGLEFFGPMPTFEQLENPNTYLAASVISEDGELMGKLNAKNQNRTWVDYSEISENVTNALVATEDVRFYNHSGIDLRGLGRVLVRTIIQGNMNAGGGSTLSQQLAKNLYPRDTTTYRLKLMRYANLGLTKFKEWETAVMIERSYTKEEIMTMYLNIFDYNYQAIGIASASSIYFNTTPDSLKLEEAAVLVGMAKNPTLYNPRRRNEKTRVRRNVVLSQMKKYGYITKQACDSLQALPLVLDFRIQSHNVGLATYFRDYLHEIMAEPKPKRNAFWGDLQYEDALWEWNNNPLYGWCFKNIKPNGDNYNLYRDGIKIYTTINSRMQAYAEEALKGHLSEDLQPGFFSHQKTHKNPPFSDDLDKGQIETIIKSTIRRTDRYRNMKGSNMEWDSVLVNFNRPASMSVFSWHGDIDTIMSPLDSILYYKHFLRSGMMSYDPHTGHVKAYVGGINFKHFQYDAVTQQRRQVGSTIKPFLYTLAMQDGLSPCRKVPNVPTTFHVIDHGKDTIWQPRSSGKKAYWDKMVTLRWGLANSENYISAWVLKQFNEQSVADLMRKMGIRSEIDIVPSLIYGTSPLKLCEMVGAYGTFANKGIQTRPIFVERIEDKSGNVISTFEPYTNEVISEETAYLMTDLLQGVVKIGTAYRLIRTYDLWNEMGGKTGTTQNQSDGWFMGVTPNLITGVWTGGEEQSIHFDDIGRGQGANMALPIFGRYMTKVYADSTLTVKYEDEFEKPLNFNMDLNCDKGETQESAGDSNDLYDGF